MITGLFALTASDEWWMEQLQPIRDLYHVEQPQENHYGIAFYSRFPLQETEIYYFEDTRTPSIYTVIQLPAGDEVIFYGEHPRPPLPENGGPLGP
jgi:hypothetical protein